VDTRLVFFRNLVLHGYAAATTSPGVHSGNTDFGGDVAYNTSWMEFDARHNKIGPNYNPEVGFVERTDSKQDWVDLTLKPRPKIPGVRELNFEGFFYNAPDTHGVLQTQEWQATFRANFNNGAYTDDDLYDVSIQRITEPFNIYKNIFIPPGVYHFARHQITYGSPQDRRFTFNLFERFGTYYTGRLNEASVRLNYRPRPRFSVSGNILWDRFRLPQGNFSVVLAGLQANYSFSRKLMTSAYIQVNTSYTHALSTNVRLRYNYRPDSDLYIVYTSGTQFSSLTAVNPAQLREQRLTIKLTYSMMPKSGRRRDKPAPQGFQAPWAVEEQASVEVPWQN
jgi:hypothetical protein